MLNAIRMDIDHNSPVAFSRIDEKADKLDYRQHI